MRLQVFLSHCGVCSRRDALKLVQSGKVTVNGLRIQEPSYPVNPGRDRVVFNDRKISLPDKLYVLLHKPKGVVTTVSDPFAKKKVLDLLPREFGHLYPVGRLDKETSGLLILTNDGALAQALTHPSFEVSKTYRVTLDRALSVSDKHRLKEGILLDDRKTAPCQINPAPSAKTLEITVHEGRKRQIRRMFASLRYQVVKLARIRQGPLSLGDLAEGKWRLLTQEEIKRFCVPANVKDFT